MTATDIPSPMDEQHEQHPLHWQIVLGFVAFVIIAVGEMLFVADGSDWLIHDRPAGITFREGKNIYHLVNTYPNLAGVI